MNFCDTQRRRFASFSALNNLSCSRGDTMVLKDECTCILSAKHSPIDPHLFAVTSEDGILQIISSYPMQESHVKCSFFAHDSIILDVEWRCDGKILFTASGDKTTVLWDVASLKWVARCNSHSSTVKTVVAHKTHPKLFATGGRDSYICLFDTRYNRRKNGLLAPAMRISCSQQKLESVQSVTSLLYLPDDRILSASAACSTLKLWDPRFTLRPSSEWPYQGQSNKFVGFTNLALDYWSSKFYAACTDGRVYSYSLSHSNNDCTKLTTQQFIVSNSFSYYVKIALSPLSDFLLCGSTEDPLIFDTACPSKPLVSLKGHPSSVSTVSWSKSDVSNLVTCSDNGELYVWKSNSAGIPCEDVFADTRNLRSVNGGHSEDFKTFFCNTLSSSKKNSILPLSKNTEVIESRVLSDRSNFCNNIPPVSKNFNKKQVYPLKDSILSQKESFLAYFSPKIPPKKKSRRCSATTAETEF